MQILFGKMPQDPKLWLDDFSDVAIEAVAIDELVPRLRV